MIVTVLTDVVGPPGLVASADGTPPDSWSLILSRDLNGVIPHTPVWFIAERSFDTMNEETKNWAVSTAGEQFRLHMFRVRLRGTDTPELMRFAAQVTAVASQLASKLRERPDHLLIVFGRPEQEYIHVGTAVAYKKS